jgi:hypothetical protein
VKLRSRRVREQLAAMQDEVKRLAGERDTALRIFMAARISTTRNAQQEYWLEFVWLNQEYRFAVNQLASFCTTVDEQHRRPRRARA